MLVKQKLAHLPANYIESYTAGINALDAAQIHNAARKYLAPDDDALVIAGDAAEVGPPIQKLGQFELIQTK